VKNSFTHAEKERIIALCIDLAIAFFIVIQVEEYVGADSDDVTASIGGTIVGLLFLSLKDCVGGVSPGKALMGCILVDQNTAIPVDTSTAFKRNIRACAAIAGALLLSLIIGIQAGETAGTVFGCFALMALLPFLAGKIDTWENTAVAIRKSINMNSHKDHNDINDRKNNPQSSSNRPQSEPPPVPEKFSKAQHSRPKKDDNININLTFSEMLQLLRLKAPFTMSELKSAYRKAISEYHPDRVSHLAKELQEIAELRSKQINFSYEALKKRATDELP